MAMIEIIFHEGTNYPELDYHFVWRVFDCGTSIAIKKQLYAQMTGWV
jgi:hypothetical protein